VRVLLFGRLADLAGWRQREFDPPPESLSALRDRLAELDAALAEALTGPGVQVALDKVLVRGEVALAGVRELAFLPPMSGG
jgi:molybdopterin synthase sulfur carrier subunit